jgi:hypothetical protein
LIGGFAMLHVKSKEEAIEWASRFARILCDTRVEGNVDINIYQLYEK